MASKEEFYQSINEDTYAGADFCRKLYGYCLTDDTFLEKVMEKFKALGRDKVIYIYSAFVTMQLHFEMQEEKKAASWIRERIDRNYEKKVREEAWKKKTYLRSLSDEELLQLLEETRQKDL